MIERARRRGRGASACLCLLAMGLGMGGWATPAAAASPAPRWIAADAAIYLEVPQPALLIDRALGPQDQGVLKAVPQFENAVRGSSYQTLLMVGDLVAEKLGTGRMEAL